MLELKTGSTGSDVLKLQQAINKYFLVKYGNANKIKVSEDGQFGPGTEKIVKQLQSELNLTADGVVGNITWTKLNSVLAATSTTPSSSPVSIEFSGAEKEKFIQLTKLVINNLEGGYYHPDMNSATGKLKKHYDYLDSSGETMFGIDRLNGKGELSENPAWDKFWGIIDAADASKNWDYNFTGGASKDELTELAIEIMGPYFIKLCKNYLTNNWQIVADSNRLLFHFAYATWNGPGWFKKFAGDIDKALKSGHSDPDYLAQVAINSRTKEGLKEGSPPSQLLIKTGEKIKMIFETLK